SAIDDHSGVKAIYYRVDGSPAKEYRGPFSVQAGGKHTLTYYAVDMVNNSEKPLQMAFQIDNEPPALQINYNVEPLKDSGDGVPVYPRDLVIGFNAVDSQTEVDKIIYRFNNEKELLYRNLVSDFEPGKVYRLTVYALDRLGNKREQSVVFRVE
ncbi:MAG TPA: Ig-like domain-containing protein, partial [Candidatus Deferrimicrobium sp.]|nr:Ig-like domain-containing protein [Candidatus Deferrimicrobium sp.]